MGAATSMSIRKQLIKEKLSGQSLKQLARAYQLSYSTACNIWRRYKGQGQAGLSPNYHRCGPQELGYSSSLYRRSTWLKRLHPHWGAPVIRTVLARRYPQEALPDVRTFQRWFHRAGYANFPKLRSPQAVIEASPVQAVHDCWQVDAKERLCLDDGTKACYLTVVDVHSGVVLASPVFPPRTD